MSKNQSVIFKSLSPVENIDENSSFIALDAAINDETVFNIAITGPFGSGKSSFLKSYIYKRKIKNKCIEISLASFSAESHTPSEKRKLQDIEYSILQKLLLKDISKPKEGYEWNYSIDFVGALKNVKLYFLSSIILALSYYPLKEYIDYFTTSYSIYFASLFNWEIPGIWKDSFRIPGIYLLLYSLNIALLWVYRLLGKISKFSTPIGEIEINQDTRLSLIDTNMENILNFFKTHSKYQFVILEDFDRLESSFIYTKLRELNQLLNSCDALKYKITFIYAVRDDLFSGEERTKFFDFMVPVIPLVNPSSSFDFLIKEYKDSRDILFEKDNRDFLQDICLYITNARTVYNVVNEYFVYSKGLTNNLSCRKLFSMIIYKNFFPKDFDNLHKNSGALYNLLHVFKNEYKRDLKQSLENKNDEIQKLIKASEQNVSKNIEDLRRIFISKILETNTRSLNGNEISNIVKNTDGQFDTIVLNQSINVRSLNNFNISQPIKVQNGLIISYQQSEKIVKIKDTKLKEEYNKELKTIQQNILKIDSYSFKELSNEYAINIFDILKSQMNLKDEETYSLDLLIFLIREGYLDENYHFLISHFFEGNITQNDRDFLLSIKNQRYVGPSYALDNPKDLIDRINLHEWDRPEILNNYLLDYIIKCVSPHINSILNQAIKCDDNSFLKQYNLSEIDINNVYPWLLNNWDNFAQKIEDLYGREAFFKLIIFLSSSRLSFSSKIAYSNLTVIRNFIVYADNLEFISYARTKNVLGSIKSFFKEYSIRFSNVSNFNDERDIQFLLDNNLFEINRKMICLILSRFEQNTVNLERNDILTSIMKNGDISLMRLVSENKEKIAVLMVENGALNENETYITPFINDVNVESLLEEIILILPQFYFQNILSVREDLHHIILDKFKLYPSINNLHTIFQSESITDDMIIEFLRNNNSSQLLCNSINEIKIDDPYIEDIKKVIISSLSDNDLPFEFYKSVIKEYPNFIETVWDEVSDGKMLFLVESSSIEFNQENFNEIMSREDKDISLIFLDNNFDDFEEIDIELSIVELYLSDSRFNIERKKRLFEEYINDFFSEGYFDFIIKFVLKYNYTNIVDNFSELWDYIEDQELKMDFLFLQFEYLEDEFLDYVHSLGGVYERLALHDRKQPKIPVTEKNRRILEILKDKDHISSFKEESYELSRVFRVQNGG